MIDIVKETDVFINKIKDEEIYKRFVVLKEKVYSDASLAYQLDEFRRKNFEIQVGSNYGVYNSYEQVLQLNSQYEELLTKLEVDEFLKLEIELSKLLTTAISKIVEEVDVRLEFLD